MNFKSRSEMFAQYIIDNDTTIRKTADYYGISKSTVHNDVSKKLRYENYEMYIKVSKVLRKNFEIKHLRGGLATKIKYEHIKNKKDD